MRRLWRFLGSFQHAGLAGAFFFLAVLATEPDSSGIGSFVLGWIYGTGVLALIRLFKVTPGAYPVVGLICGPVPAALLLARQLGGEQWGGVWLVMALFGCIVGTLEWARIRRDAATPPSD